MTALILVAVVVAAVAGGRVATMVNGLYFGVRFVLAGGLSALGGAGNKAEAIDQVIRNMGEVKKLLPADQPGMALAVIMVGLAGLGLLLGFLKVLRGRASVLGLFLGLAGGYLLTGYLFAALAPDHAFLPLPIMPRGLLSASKAAAVSVAPAAAGPLREIADLLGKGASNAQLPLLIALAVMIFVVLATRFSGGGKRG